MWHMNIILLRGGGVSDLIFPNFVTLDKECIIILSQHMWCIMLPQDFQILIDVIPVLLRKRMISEQKQHQNPTLPCIDQNNLKPVGLAGTERVPQLSCQNFSWYQKNLH